MSGPSRARPIAIYGGGVCHHGPTMSELTRSATPEELVTVAEVRPLERVAPAPLPVPQVAAVAATSFLAGAATLAVARRRSTRRAARRRGGLPILGSRSFLVDIHLLDR